MRSLSWGCACHGTVASHLLAELPKPALNPVLHCLAGLGRPPLDLLGELVEGRVGRGRGVQLPERLVVDPKVLSEHEVVVLVRHGGGSAGGKPRPLGAGLGCYCPPPPLSSKNESFEFSQLDRSRSKDFHGLVGKSRPNRRPGCTGHTHSASPTKSFFFFVSVVLCVRNKEFLLRTSSVSCVQCLHQPKGQLRVRGPLEYETTRLIRADTDTERKNDSVFKGRSPPTALEVHCMNFVHETKAQDGTESSMLDITLFGKSSRDGRLRKNLGAYCANTCFLRRASP